MNFDLNLRGFTKLYGYALLLILWKVFGATFLPKKVAIASPRPHKLQFILLWRYRSFSTQFRLAR